MRFSPITLFIQRTRRRLSALTGDRRGVTAVTFALMTVSLLGIVGLATEAGGWFLARGQLQIVADSAAMAAVIAESQAAGTGSTAASAVAVANGLAGGATTVISAGAVVNGVTVPVATVTVSSTVTPAIAALFLAAGTTPLTVNVQAAATLVPTGTACLLATATALTVAQPQYSGQSLAEANAAGGCAYASNADGMTAINITNDPATQFVYAWVTQGDCPNCPFNPAGRPMAGFQPPVYDPYQTPLESSAILAAMGGAGNVICIADSRAGSYLVPAAGLPGNATYPPVPTGGPYYAYCDASVQLTGGANYVIGPGVYLFVNATLTVSNGATLACGLPNGAGIPVNTTLCDNGTFAGIPSVVTQEGVLTAGTGVTFLFTGTTATTAGGNGCGTGGGGVLVTISGTVSNAANAATVAPGAITGGTMPPGPTLTICPTASVQLSPPAMADPYPTQNFIAAFQQYGVLFWRDPVLGGTATGADIQSAVVAFGWSVPHFTYLNGLQYFPQASVTYGANSQTYQGVQTATMNCSTLVAGTINLANYPASFLDCNLLNGYTTVPQVVAARVIQ